MVLWQCCRRILCRRAGKNRCAFARAFSPAGRRGQTVRRWTSQNIRTRDFKWTTNFIYSHSHNEVTKLYTNLRVIDLIRGSGFAMEGYPNHSIFSIPFRGLNEEGIPTFVDQDSEYNKETGELIENISTTGIYFQTSDPDKLHFLEYSGVADPTDIGSIGNTFEWKGLRLNVFITGSFGNVVRLDPVFKSRYSDLNSMPREFKNRWVDPPFVE